MGLFCRKETGIYYLKIRVYADGVYKYKKISLGTKNRYIAEQIYNAYLLDIVKEKINVRRNSDVLSISALQTSCLRGSSKHKNNSLPASKSKSPKTPKNSLKNICIYVIILQGEEMTVEYIKKLGFCDSQ